MTLARSVTRPLRVIRGRLRSQRQQAMHLREVRRGSSHELQLDRVPIFVLGAPRSGTTLLYQLLVDGLDVGWLANAHMRHPGGVSWIEAKEHPRAARVPSAWTSSYGATREPWEPSEAGEFWYRFVPRTPHQLTGAHATPARIRAIRAAVREFANACGASVVFKNVYNSLRIPVLAAALPEARFLLIERELESNARSILVGRERHGGVGRWLSARPDGAEGLDAANPAEQAVWQVTQMNEVARRELEALGAERSMTVSYDELCADPAALLGRIHRWLTASGVLVERRADCQLPATFDRKGGGVLGAEIGRQLRATIDAHAGGVQ